MNKQCVCDLFTLKWGCSCGGGRYEIEKAKQEKNPIKLTVSIQPVDPARVVTEKSCNHIFPAGSAVQCLGCNEPWFKAGSFMSCTALVASKPEWTSIPHNWGLDPQNTAYSQCCTWCGIRCHP